MGLSEATVAAISTGICVCVCVWLGNKRRGFRGKRRESAGLRAGCWPAWPIEKVPRTCC